MLDAFKCSCAYEDEEGDGQYEAVPYPVVNTVAASATQDTWGDVVWGRGVLVVGAGVGPCGFLAHGPKGATAANLKRFLGPHPGCYTCCGRAQGNVQGTGAKQHEMHRARCRAFGSGCLLEHPRAPHKQPAAGSRSNRATVAQETGHSHRPNACTHQSAGGALSIEGQKEHLHTP